MLPSVRSFDKFSKRPMSFFNWFSPKKSTQTPKSPQKLASPVGPNSAAEAGSVGPTGDATLTRRAERVERREQLYAVLRDAMTRAGVLSASYKFKVLSLDSRGGNYLVMIDLASLAMVDAARMAEIEAVIAQSAKSRHEILVAAVYWRLSDLVTAGLSPKLAPPSTRAAANGGVPAAQDRVDINAMLAFKSAFASVAVAVPLSASGEILKSGRRNPTPKFENTEVLDSEERSPLSSTQYGELR